MTDRIHTARDGLRFYPVDGRLVACARCAAVVVADDEGANLNDHEAFHTYVTDIGRMAADARSRAGMFTDRLA